MAEPTREGMGIEHRGYAMALTWVHELGHMTERCEYRRNNLWILYEMILTGNRVRP